MYSYQNYLFIELSLIKSCWSCKYKLLIGRFEGIAELNWTELIWHQIIWHLTQITPELSLINTWRSYWAPSRKLKLNSVSLAAKKILWSDQGETRRGIFPPSYYDEFQSHSPEWNMILVVVPVIPYICLCSQSGRNWKNKSKNFEYLDPVYELIDAKKIFLATTSPSVRTETEIGIWWD